MTDHNLRTTAFPDFVQLERKDDVLRVLTELADESLSPTQRAVLDMSYGITKHRLQMTHLHTAFDLHVPQVM